MIQKGHGHRSDSEGIFQKNPCNAKSMLVNNGNLLCQDSQVKTLKYKFD